MISLSTTLLGVGYIKAEKNGSISHHPLAVDQK